MQQKLVFRGGKIVLPDAVMQGDLVVENGKITELSSCAATDGCRVVDVSGKKRRGRRRHDDCADAGQ